MAKYEIPDEFWDDDESEVQATGQLVSVDTHKVSVILTTDPSAEMGYGREKYEATISSEDDGTPYVLYVIEYRWKGNYWRDTTEWDWQDVPIPVRQTIASRLAVDGPEDLESGVRLVDEGGESRWEKYHKPRVEAMSGDEMWGSSFLRDALRGAENAAESLAVGSDAHHRVEELVGDIQDIITEIEDLTDGEEGGGDSA